MIIMYEIFKDIPGYVGLYQVSNWGRVKSLERKVKNQYNFYTIKERILKFGVGNGGYCGITLYKKDKHKKQYDIHRLVMLVFYGKSDLQVNHKDGNKLNNRVDNLEYCTASENMLHAYKNNLITSNKECRNKSVYQYSIDGKFIKKYFSIAEASKMTGVHRQSIGQCMLGRLKTSGKFAWKKDVNL